MPIEIGMKRKMTQSVKCVEKYTENSDSDRNRQKKKRSREANMLIPRCLK